MLVIRKEQNQVLAKNMENSFVQNLVEHLRTDFHAEMMALGLAEDQLRPLVCSHIDLARVRGIRNRGDLTTYVECIAYLGPHFDTDNAHPYLRETLLRNDLVGDEKMDRISEYLIFAIEEKDRPEGDDSIEYSIGQPTTDSRQPVTY